MTQARCGYEFTPETMQAIWLEYQQTQYQQTQAATCPETGAAIAAALQDGEPTDAPRVRVRCERCGREDTFTPATLTGVQEVE
jgi:hypothetical protein